MYSDKRLKWDKDTNLSLYIVNASMNNDSRVLLHQSFLLKIYWTERNAQKSIATMFIHKNNNQTDTKWKE